MFFLWRRGISGFLWGFEWGWDTLWDLKVDREDRFRAVLKGALV